jgi:hypothetical protein
MLSDNPPARRIDGASSPVDRDRASELAAAPTWKVSARTGSRGWTQ